MKYGNIFWGVILITLGVLFAMRNFDIFYFSWHGVFRLWPLIFVFWGIALLPVKAMFKLILTVATVVIGLVILSNNPRSHSWGIWWPDRFTWEQEYDDDRDYNEEEENINTWEDQLFSDTYDFHDKYVTLNLEAVAGEFDLKGVTSELYEFETEGNAGEFKASAKNVNDSTKLIAISQENIRKRKNYKNYFDLKLNQKPIWEINIDVGAADIEMDLSSFKVKKVDIDGGASAIELKLGDKYIRTYVNIDAGASGIEIKVPASSACEVNTSTILSGRDLDGFQKIDRGLYQTPNFSNSAHQIVIDIDAAVSGITVERY
jgi:hypothetical protein